MICQRKTKNLSFDLFSKALSDRLGLKLTSFGGTFISNIFDSLGFNRNNSLVVIQDNSELLATLSETTVSDFTVEYFVDI